VQRIYPERGFGFIRCLDRLDDKGKAVEFFFHATGLPCPIDRLQEGERVEFEVRETPKGLRAESVQRLP
jgi:cold shock CspA family protein